MKMVSGSCNGMVMTCRTSVYRYLPLYMYITCMHVLEWYLFVVGLRFDRLIVQGLRYIPAAGSGS